MTSGSLEGQEHEALRQLTEWVLELLLRQRMSKILGDDSGLAVSHVDDQVWLREDWMPRAAAAGLKAAASKSPFNYFGKQSVAQVQSGSPAGLALRSFEDLAQARAWLTSIDG